VGICGYLLRDIVNFWLLTDFRREQKMPYEEYKAVEAVMKIVNENLRLKFDHCPNAVLLSVLENCFNEDPKQRSTWEKIIPAIEKAIATVK
jgi:hypothetical protein